jgi:hypothetical protein
MIKRTTFITCALFRLACAEVTPAQTTTYSEQELYGFDNLVDGFGNIFLFESEVIAGLPKFDPSLGTLRQVRLSVTGSATLEMSLFSGSIEDDTQAFTAFFESDFEGDFPDSADVGVIYSPTGRDTAFGIGLDFIDAPTLGVIDEDPDFWTFDDFYFDDYSQDEFFLHDGVENPPLVIMIDLDDPDVNPDDFIGEGEVTALTFEGYCDLDTTQAVIENLSDASLDVILGYQSGEVSIRYLYEPSAPQVVEYGRNGDQYLIRFSAEPGREGWQVFGGRDLLAIETNHTGDAQFSETSPGIYTTAHEDLWIQGPPASRRLASSFPASRPARRQCSLNLSNAQIHKS